MKIISRLVLLLPLLWQADARLGSEETRRELNYCGELIDDGKSSTGSTSSWVAGGGGIITKHPWGPNGREGSFKHTRRSGTKSGPTQSLNPDCFVEGKRYDIKFKYRIADETTGEPIKCTTNNKNTPTSCAIATIAGKYNNGKQFFKDAKNTMQPWTYEADEWVDYSSYFWANSDIVNSNDIDFVIYGPEKGVIIQYDEVSVTQYLDPTNMEDLMMGRSDPVDPEEFQCTGPCCELFQNGDAEDGDSTGWDPIYGGAIISHPFGPFKSTKSFKHLRRASFIGGPGQALNTKCLIPGEKYKLSGMIKLTNEYNIPYACTTTAWRTAGTCPLATIRYRTIDGGDEKFLNINNSFGPGYWDKDLFNTYEAVFTVPEDLHQSEEATFVLRGPPAETIIMFDDFSLTPWHHSPEVSPEDLETVTPCDNECCQMIQSGDAEVGDVKDWYVAGGGDIREHSFGPEGSTKSFKHVGRWGINDGPAQVVNPGCFIPGKRYIFHAQLKMAHPDGRPFRCSTQQWNQDGTCPIFSMKYTTGEGKEKIINSDNDNLPMAWNKDYFNPFRGIFSVPEDFSTATQAYIVIRGASAGKIIMFDDVKLEPYLHVPPEPPHTELQHYSAPVCQGECCDLIMDRSADEGSTGAWQPKFGGEISVVPDGPAGHTSSFMHNDRFTPHSGPYQQLNTDCLIGDEMYKIDLKFKMENRYGNGFQCDTVTWGEWGKCPMVSVFFLSSGKWNSIDITNRFQISEMTDGWNDYEGVFTVPRVLANSPLAYFMIRGPGSRAVIKFTDVHIKPFLFTPQVDPPPLEIPACENECCELIENGDAVSGTTDGWFPESSGAIHRHKWDPDNKENGSFYHVRRSGASEGPAQILNPGCLVPGKAYTLNMFIRTRDASNVWYTCETQEWNQVKTCPIVSLKYRTADGVQKYYNIQNQEGIKDYNGNWYGFTAMFEVPLEVNLAYEVDFLIRGPPKNYYIYWDDVSIKPFLHVPEEPQYDSEILETKETICTGDCCELIKSNEADTGAKSDWFDSMGGAVIKHPHGPPGRSFSWKHIGRAIKNSGPAQQIDTRCLVAGTKYKFTGLFKLAHVNGLTYACDTFNYVSDTVCPLFSINYRNAEGKWRFLNAENEFHPSVWHKDYFNKYEAVFEVPQALAESDRAFIVFRGPPSGDHIFFSDVHLNPYFTDTAITLDEPMPVCDNGCCELTRNGDAESGTNADWIAIGGGSVMVHYHGPPGETKSFRHIGRTGPNMGPGQVLNTTCLVVGEEYEIKGLIKVQDSAGQNFQCDTTTWNQPTTCPMVRIRYFTKDGKEKYFDVNNRIPPVAWKKDEYNDFTAFFTVTQALAEATDAYYIFSGPPAGHIILFDNVSLKPWLHVPPPPSPSLSLDGLRYSTLGWGSSCEGACCELVQNGSADNGSNEGWMAYGGGKIRFTPNGSGGTSYAFRHMYRPYVQSGPGQRLNTACLIAGQRYRFTMMYKLNFGNTFYKCNSWTFHDPLACPLFSIRFKKPSGEWAYINEVNDLPLSVQTTNYNVYEAIFTVPPGLANSDHAYWVLRGLPKDKGIFFDTVSISPHLFDPAIESVPDVNADQACDGACCEMVLNGDAENRIRTGWQTFPAGTIAFDFNGGANGGTKSFISDGRAARDDGPGQLLDPACFSGGESYMFKAMFKTADASGAIYPCKPGFDTVDACPVFSIKYTRADGSFKWINGRNAHSDSANGFSTANFSPYESLFEVPAELSQSTEAYWVMRGLPAGYKIYIDKVSLGPIENWGF